GKSQPAAAKVVRKSSVPPPDSAGTGCGAMAPASVSISRVALRRKGDTHPMVNVPRLTPPWERVPEKNGPLKPTGGACGVRASVIVRVGVLGKEPLKLPAGGCV